MELNSQNIKKILFVILCGALIFAGAQNLSLVFGFIANLIDIFSPVIAALCIAFVLNVLLVLLENKVFFFMDKAKSKFVLKLKRPICLLLTYVIAFGIVAAMILIIIPDIIDTITYLAGKMPHFVTDVREWAMDIFRKYNLNPSKIPELNIDWSAVSKIIIDWLSGYSGKIVDGAVNITTSVFSGVFDAVFSLVISAYVLLQKEKISRFTKSLLDAFFPEKTTGVIYHIADKTYNAFSKFIGGQCLEALILGVLCFIGMTIFGFPNAVIISVVITFTAIIPIVGATIGAVIGCLLIIITDPFKAFLFVVFFLILQQIEGNLIYPKVVGKAVGLPGVIVVSAVLVGGNMGGVLGALLAVPTCAVIYTLLREAIVYANDKKAEAKVSAAEGDENTSKDVVDAAE